MERSSPCHLHGFHIAPSHARVGLIYVTEPRSLNRLPQVDRAAVAVELRRTWLLGQMLAPPCTSADTPGAGDGCDEGNSSDTGHPVPASCRHVVADADSVVGMGSIPRSSEFFAVGAAVGFRVRTPSPAAGRTRPRRRFPADVGEVWDDATHETHRRDPYLERTRAQRPYGLPLARQARQAHRGAGGGGCHGGLLRVLTAFQWAYRDEPSGGGARRLSNVGSGAKAGAPIRATGRGADRERPRTSARRVPPGFGEEPARGHPRSGAKIRSAVDEGSPPEAEPVGETTAGLLLNVQKSVEPATPLASTEASKETLQPSPCRRGVRRQRRPSACSSAAARILASRLGGRSEFLRPGGAGGGYRISEARRTAGERGSQRTREGGHASGGGGVGRWRSPLRCGESEPHDRTGRDGQCRAGTAYQTSDAPASASGCPAVSRYCPTRCGWWPGYLSRSGSPRIRLYSRGDRNDRAQPVRRAAGDTPDAACTVGVIGRGLFDQHPDDEPRRGRRTLKPWKWPGFIAYDGEINMSILGGDVL